MARSKHRFPKTKRNEHGTTLFMLDRYEPKEFEVKWRERWEEAELFKTLEESDRPKFYGLDFFPFPSGAGLSVGHCRNYIPTDVLCRMKRMQGFNVLHPMGFDAFGLPAENEAIKRQRNPSEMVFEYGENYRRQMDLVGVSYDWSRSFRSSDPDYYRWTQWIFKKLYENDLAYRKLASVNWCPKDKTALANEEVVGGLCERCGTAVEKRFIPQWFFKITAYAERLLNDLDSIDWPEGIKAQQRAWIGRSEGVQFFMKLKFPTHEEDQGDFELKSAEKRLEVYTTRIDTLFGVTFAVLAPEHPMLESLLAQVPTERQEAVRAYVAKAGSMSEADRLVEDRPKTGEFTGVYAINPCNGEEIPLYVADYVLTGYGTGAIMAVPAHDQRDFEFAKAFGIRIQPIYEPDSETVETWSKKLGITPDEVRKKYEATPEEMPSAYIAKLGRLIHSGPYTGMSYEEASPLMTSWVEENEIGERKVQYRLRDWLISRQRYWGCPIPVVYDAEGNEELVSDSALPVELPPVQNYAPGEDGKSPLASIPEFLNVATSDGSLGQRETDTMGGFACSSWYFFRFCDPTNDERGWDFDKAKYWLPVDAYVGGAEHAVLHLLYARFWTKVLFDLGLSPVNEPFQRLQNQGQVLAMTPYRKPRPGETLNVGEDGILISFEEAKELAKEDLIWKWARMSKSKGNVVTPDEMIEQFGADALRIYELFVAPFDADVQWSNDGMQGASRFLNRIFKLVADVKPRYRRDWKSEIDLAEMPAAGKDLRRWSHQAIQKVSADIEAFGFNTAVSALMIFLNSLADEVRAPRAEGDAYDLAWSEAIETFVLLIAPMAPFSADELWENLGNEGFTFVHAWPKLKVELTAEDSIEVAIQVNGKLRDTVTMPAQATQEEIVAAAMDSTKVQNHLEGKTIRKTIYVPGKLVNIVAN